MSPSDGRPHFPRPPAADIERVYPDLATILSGATARLDGRVAIAVDSLRERLGLIHGNAEIAWGIHLGVQHGLFRLSEDPIEYHGPGNDPADIQRRDGAGAQLLEATDAFWRHSTTNTFDGCLRSPREGDTLVLALSGGGLRATLFQMGILLCLAHANRLNDVKEIVSVSGGSILAAHFAKHWQSAKRNKEGFVEVAAALVKFARTNVRDSVFIPWLWSRLSFGWWVKQLGRSYRLESVYKEHFGETTLGDIAECLDSVRVAIVATDTVLKERVAFTSDRVLRFRLNPPEGVDKMDPRPVAASGVHLALAVAASSSFPPFFPQMKLHHDSLSLVFDEFTDTLALNDGGVAGNTGIEVLLALRAIGKSSASFALIADAERPQTTRPRANMFANIEAQGEAIGEAARERASKELGVNCATIRLARRTHGSCGLPWRLQTLLMGYRTDLDSPRWQEIHALLMHGVAASMDTCGLAPKADGRQEIQEMISAVLRQAGCEDQIVEPTEADLKRCHRRPLLRVVSHAIVVSAMLCTLIGLGFRAIGCGGSPSTGAISSSTSSPSTSSPQTTAARLKQLDFYVRRDHDDRRIESFLLVAGGQEGAVPQLAPIGPNDDFRLVGEFDRPTTWYLLWIDPGGKVTVVSSDASPVKAIEYPDRVKYVSVSPNDPAGYHVLLIATAAQLERNADDVNASLSAAGKPPEMAPATWHQLRSPGSVQAGGEAPLSYVLRVESLLPKGLQPVHVLFFKSAK